MNVSYDATTEGMAAKLVDTAFEQLMADKHDIEREVEQVITTAAQRVMRRRLLWTMRGPTTRQQRRLRRDGEKAMT